MIYGIMQPYFFPYVGYFSLIEYADRFIFFDTPQYISHGWVNRNRILNPKGQPIYITVPIKKSSRETPINQIEIVAGNDWKEKIYGQITLYKKKALFYKDTEEFLHYVLDEFQGVCLSELNIRATIESCKKIGIDCRFDTFSKMNLEIASVQEPDEWALNITKALGGDVYVNPPGGQSFFDKSKYDKENIELRFLESNLRKYIQRIGRFEPGLSIIDVMMFCKNEEIKEIIKDYKII